MKPVNHLKSLYWDWRSDLFGTKRVNRFLRRYAAKGSTLSLAKAILSGTAHRGYCPICDSRTIFVIEGPWLRDEYRCRGCRSIPRFRHIVDVLRKQFPDYRTLSIHESSPHGPVLKLLRREVPEYTSSHFWPDVPLGVSRNEIRCENLEKLTFKNESFDLFITQDVLEHVLNPKTAFREIARTLKPGGAHIFTIPWYAPKRTLTRASFSGQEIIYHEPKEYHGNPIDDGGALVVTEWGSDLGAFIFENGGLHTTAFLTLDRTRGLDGEFLEVFVSRKAQ